MKKLIANYHTHTSRCGHADGEDEEYIQAAIKAGIKELGISDHMPFKTGSYKPIRMDFSELDDYVSSLQLLREKYKDKIKIYIGLECEYMSDYLDYYETLKEHGIEYFICGQHCFLNAHLTSVWWCSVMKHGIHNYITSLIDAMKTGLFTYIAHPDLFMNGIKVWNEEAIEESWRLIKAAKELDIPLEINVAGIRYAEYKHRQNKNNDSIEDFYPCGKFWDLVAQNGNKVIIGVDAHAPQEFLDGTTEEALAFAKEHRIKPIKKLHI